MNIDNSNVIDNQLANNKTKTKTSTCYVLSACNFSALGLSTLLRHSNRIVIMLNINNPSQFTDYFHLSTLGLDDRFIVYLPDEPYMVLVTLKHLTLLINTEKNPINILFMSRLQPSWLYSTLKNLAPGRKKISSVRLIKSDTNTFHMFRLLKKDPDAFPLLEHLARGESESSKHNIEGITKRELDVMLKFLSGNSIMAQSIENNLSIKTLYSQKVTGLKKMSTQFISLTKLLPGRDRERQKIIKNKTHDNTLLRNNSFTEAIRRGLFFQVYQPVTDREMKVRGFEILSRWYKNGKVLLPMEFSPHIRTEKLWITLTAYILKNAIEKINLFKGKYWFSVNIPTCLSDNPALLRMLNTAKKQLTSPELLDKLILEFSEDTDWSKDAPSVKILRKLHEQNYQVYLDDCFSDKNVIFPVRQVNFSGYKLNMSVVNSFMCNNNDHSLIKGLAYYSQLMGSQCVAEGVDTYEKFKTLKNMGVTAFQGDYFSRPVLEEELDIVLTKLKK
ncbi:EAL domain-containing protein [Enterobacter mori]